MLTFSHQTDTGKKRDHNEDFYDFDEGLGLYIVCDGMGGHAAGEVASELTCNEILKSLKSKEKVIKSFNDSSDSAKRKRIVSLIKDAVSQANERVYKTQLHDPEKSGMGTTLVMSLITPVGIFVAHVGDSRAYLVRRNKVQQLTEDHSLVNELIKSGAVSKEKAKDHPHGNVITKAIGIQEVITPDILFYEVMEGDLIFLCSDGLHEYLDEPSILKKRHENTVETLSVELVKLANHRGGKDNITCICLQWGEHDAPPAHPSDVTVANKIETLKKIPLFHSLNYKELSQLLEIIQIRNIKKNEEVMREGTAGEDMFIILKGEVQVLYGKEVVACLGPGKFFGEMALIDKSPRSATVICLGDCKLMRLTRSELFPLIKKESTMGLKIFWAFLQNMNRRLRENDKKVFEIHQDYVASLETGERTGTFNLSSLD